MTLLEEMHECVNEAKLAGWCPNVVMVPAGRIVELADWLTEHDPFGTTPTQGHLAINAAMTHGYIPFAFRRKAIVIAPDVQLGGKPQAAFIANLRVRGSGTDNWYTPQQYANPKATAIFDIGFDKKPASPFEAKA